MGSWQNRWRRNNLLVDYTYQHGYDDKNVTRRPYKIFQILTIGDAAQELTKAYQSSSPVKASRKPHLQGSVLCHLAGLTPNAPRNRSYSHFGQSRASKDWRLLATAPLDEPRLEATQIDVKVWRNAPRPNGAVLAPNN